MTDRIGEEFGSLPSRFFSLEEIQELGSELPDSVRLTVNSTMGSPEGVAVSTVLFFIDARDDVELVGYDPEREAWIIVDIWSADAYNPDEIEAATDEWARETYGNENVAYDKSSELIDEDS